MGARSAQPADRPNNYQGNQALSRPDCRSGRRFAAWFGGLLAAAIVVSTPGAWAQEPEEPVRLIPTDPEAIDILPEPLPGETTPPLSQTKPASSVEVDELKAVPVGPDSLGLSEAGIAPLPRLLWQGAARSFVEAVIGRMPHGAVSPAMRSLAIRLLTSAGAPPEAPEGGAVSGTFLSARAAALARMGEYQLAGALLRQAPATGQADPMRARIESDVYFLAGGDYAPACAQVRAEVPRGGDSYWQKALVFCQIIANEAEAARLGLDLLRESDAGDTAFLVLADALLGVKAKLEKFPDPTPLHFAMLRKAKRPVPEGAVIGANPAVLRLIAEATDNPMKLRIAAVEAAEAAGTVPAESVAHFYAAAEFKKDQLAKAVSAAEKLDGPLARALLYRAAQAETVPEARAKLLQAAYASAREDGIFPTVARATFALVSKIEPAPALVWFAGDAARALLAAAEPQAAGRWRQLVAVQGAADPEAQKIADSLWPIMMVAGATTAQGFDNARFDAWLEANAAVTADHSARANLVLSLLQAIGIKVPEDAWRALALNARQETAPLPAQAIMKALDDAIGAKRLGETVLLGLVALGEAGPAGAATMTLARVVEGLKAVGLDQPARALALEAALGKGL